MNASDTIQPRHLNRRAMIYVRQSTPQQVISNRESQRLQYALRDRATQLGWHEKDVEIVDVDLGQSGTTMESRIGFQHLVSEVALGNVGVVMAYDATRLSRNCSHWYQLLDLCGRADCLIADRDGVYDPTSINGRLLLGLKGQISELEMHTIRARLNAGRWNKAKRGDLAVALPVGLVRLDDGRVQKDPNREVQDRIDLIFSSILEKRSVGQLVRYLNKHGLKVPRKSIRAHGRIAWNRANSSNIGTMVTNPAYAGTFAYARIKPKKTDNSLVTRTPLAERKWRVCLHDKYPAYISWETFGRIDKMLQDNYAEYDRNKTRGIPREGKTLLQGIVYCGQCGHKMCVQYKGTPKYLCNRLRQMSPGDPVCQFLSSDPLDDQVVQWFFDALSVADINASQQALQEADKEHELVVASRRQQLDRLRYQAQLAERQYQQTDPDNRLVAAELEQRWEFALRELKTEEERQAAESSAPCWAIPEDLLAALQDVGPRLPELWNQGLFTTAQKKTLLRSLIDKVVLHRVRKDEIHVRVVWRGGATTSADVEVRVGTFSHMKRAKELEAMILKLSKEDLYATEIALQLTAEGFHSPTSDRVLTSTVRTIRKKHGILQNSKSRPVHVAGYLTTAQLEKKLGIRHGWIQEKICSGAIEIKKDASSHCYLFPDSKRTVDQIKQLYEGKIKKYVKGRASR